MFRRAFSSALKLSVGFGGVQVAAAAVALSDKELKKKPQWYKDSVHSLEDALRSMGQRRIIENITTLDSAYDTLQWVEDCNNPQVSWRLGRILVEKSELVHDHHQKEKMLHQAVEHLHRALAHEGAQGIAGAHKWYAMALRKLKSVNHKHKAVAKADTEIESHLKRAVELDDKDPISWHVMGLHHEEKKCFDEAMKCYKTAEGIKSEFSATNAYHLGVCAKHLGKAEEAAQWLKKCLALPIKTISDGRVKIQAKEILAKAYKVTSVENPHDF